MGALDFGISELQNETFQREYNWSFIPPDISVSGGGVIKGSDVSKYCQSVSFGDYSMDKLTTIRYGYLTRGYAGVFSVEVVKTTFLRALDGNSLDDIIWNYIFAWRQLVVSGRGFYNPKSKYGLTGYVYVYDTSGSVAQIFMLRGLFPMTYPKHHFTYDGKDVNKYSIDFNVDIVESLPSREIL